MLTNYVSFHSIKVLKNTFFWQKKICFNSEIVRSIKILFSLILTELDQNSHTFLHSNRKIHEIIWRMI